MKRLFLTLLVVILAICMFVPAIAYASDGTEAAAPEALPAWAWALIAVGVIVIVLLLMFLILPKVLAIAQKKGYDVSGFLSKAGIVIEKADTAVESLVKMGLPLGIVDMVLDYAATGVKYAEQLWWSQQLDKDKRGEEARKAIIQMLTLAGLPEDKVNSAEIQTLINIGIEAAVGELGHAIAETEYVDEVQG